MKSTFLLLAVSFLSHISYADTNNNTFNYRAVIYRQDNNNIVFNFEEQRKDNNTIIYILNAGERLRVDSVRFTGDSVFIKMPVFESSLKAKVTGSHWSGTWTKGTADAESIMPFTAEKSSERFALTDGPAAFDINGRWAVKFSDEQSDEANSIAEFRQNGNKIEGTFITPTGDYRYLEGVVTGKHLKMSGFDGGHAVQFTATIANKTTIENGHYYSGLKYTADWSASKNSKAEVKTDEAAMFLKPGEEKLDFKFPDLSGSPISINDQQFKNKVVIVQLMGSWCPNCMDETAFLSDYYNKNKKKGVEIVALAYEYSTDFERSVKSLLKFKQRFNIEYPVLITGVTVSDTMRTEKTLPQVTKIKVFPSSIILDKKGKVRKLDTGFFGPGTGKHYEAYKQEFYKTVNALLQE